MIREDQQPLKKLVYIGLILNLIIFSFKLNASFCVNDEELKIITENAKKYTYQKPRPNIYEIINKVKNLQNIINKPTQFINYDDY